MTTETRTFTLSGWAQPLTSPHVYHHFPANQERSTCGAHFWMGPRGETGNPRAVKCEQCSM